MLTMPLSNLVNTVVNQFLIGQGRPDQALHFHFDVSLSHYSGDNHTPIYQRRGLHVLYFMEPGSTCETDYYEACLKQTPDQLMEDYLNFYENENVDKDSEDDV